MTAPTTDTPTTGASVGAPAWEIRQGDVLTRLREMHSESVQCVVTSPPYWGLRSYGTSPSIWGGMANCAHQWQIERTARPNGSGGKPSETNKYAAKLAIKGSENYSAFTEYDDRATYTDTCRLCGAWRGEFGLEPDLAMFIEHFVQVFREVKRVLRRDGVLFLNMGDSYYGAGYTNNKNTGGVKRDNGGKQRHTVTRRVAAVDEPYEDACDTSDKEPVGYRGRDCLCGSLCGVCHVAYQTGKSRNSNLLVAMLTASLSSSTPAHRAKQPAHLPTSHFVPEVARSVDATTGQVPPSSPVDGQLHAVLVSILGGSSPQLLDVCLQRGKHAECLLCARSLVPYAQECVDKTAYPSEQHSVSPSTQHSGENTHGKVSTGGALPRHNSGRVCDCFSYLHYTTTSRPLRLKPKDLCMIPARIAIALQDDGWYVRSEIVWCKRAPMPESVTDRPTSATEKIYLLTKSERYFYDQEAVREPYNDGSLSRYAYQFGKGPAAIVAKSPAVGDGSGHNAMPNPAGRNQWNYWLLSPEPNPDAHFACVDDQTEALTPDGWRYHHELTDGDTIASFENGFLTWQRATFHRYPYSGDLVAIEKRDTSQRLTPNHRCLIRRRGGKPEIVRADALKPGMEMPMSAPFLLDERNGIGIRWAELVGWYITEGYNRKPGNIHIYQSQSANPQKVERIRIALQLVGAEWSEYIRTREWRGRPSVEVLFNIKGRAAEYLQELAPQKVLPPRLMSLPHPEAEALLGTLIDGDGHRRKDGRACIIQKDRGCIDAMQMLAIRLGYRAHISPRKEGGYTLYLTKGPWLTLRGTNGKHSPIASEPYIGTVWCPSVPSGLWLARRNGKPFITGNTFPTEIPRRCIAAGTSERGCCPACGGPWRRVVERLAHYGKRQDRSQPEGVMPQVDSSEWRPPTVTDKGWEPSCKCPPHEPIPCTVLDPFSGSGTTVMVALRLGRRGLGIELQPDYVAMSVKRIINDSPLFNMPQEVA